MTAAVTAAALGLDVIVVEAAECFGGTSARSGGVVWIPQSHYAEQAGVVDSRDQVKTYLLHELGNLYADTMVDAYLDAGPEMLRFMHERTAVRFKCLTGAPDYHPNVAGAAAGGRSLRAVAIDAGDVGVPLTAIEQPITQTMLFGGMMISGDDLPAFLTITRSVRSALRVARLTANFAMDRLRGPRGRRLANGNALVGRLLKSCVDYNVRLWLRSPVTALLRDAGTVTGAAVARDGRSVRVQARRGVVLATGGFSSDAELRSELYSSSYARPVHSMAVPRNNGSGIRLGRDGGGEVDLETAHPTIFVPASEIPGLHATGRLFPHLLDRNKPGMIVVGPDAKRFVSEAASYQDFVPAMIEACRDRADISCHLICSHRALRLYGLGPARPFPLPFRRWLRNGYLIRGDTIGSLASKIGLDPEALTETVTRYNAFARAGKDEDFHKGENAYERAMGDFLHAPNPNLAPLDDGPFYAVKLLPGDIGTMRGLRADQNARVLDANRIPIPGLYAVGNDMANLMAGSYPGGGVSLGPGMTFGYLAAKHMASTERPRIG